jgi:hypothetical protein
MLFLTYKQTSNRKTKRNIKKNGLILITELQSVSLNIRILIHCTELTSVDYKLNKKMNGQIGGGVLNKTPQSLQLVHRWQKD